MADKTKYYYLKIKENFFDSEDMKLLESMDNGYIYSNILMKMYLLSLKNGGKLMYKDKIPYNSKMLSTLLNHNVDILDKAIKVFKELNLIEILDSGAIFMLDIQNYIGKSSDEADRKRLYRNQIENEKKHLLMDICPDICQTNLSNIKDRDKDKDIDKDIDINKDITTTTNINIYDYIEDNFGRFISPIEKEKLDSWLLLFPEDVLKYAIEISVLQNKKTFSYFEGILNNWKSCGYKTLQEIKDNDVKPNKTGTVIPKWFNGKITDEINDSESQEMEDLLNSIIL